MFQLFKPWRRTGRARRTEREREREERAEIRSNQFVVGENVRTEMHYINTILYALQTNNATMGTHNS